MADTMGTPDASTDFSRVAIPAPLDELRSLIPTPLPDIAQANDVSPINVRELLAQIFGNSATAPQQDQNIATKQRRRIDPLDLPIAYEAYFYGDYMGRNEPGLPIKIGDNTYRLLRRVDDQESGFAGVTFVNPETGHAVVIFKGMDRPGLDEGDGALGFLTDLTQTSMASRQGYSNQSDFAEKMYLAQLKDPQITSIEVFGYSMGTTPANLVAARYGAVVTNAADLGANLDVMANRRDAGLKDPVFAQHLDAHPGLNIFSINLEGDMIRRLGRIGPTVGQTIPMQADGGHDPEDYRRAALITKEKEQRASASPPVRIQVSMAP